MKPAEFNHHRLQADRSLLCVAEVLADEAVELGLVERGVATNALLENKELVEADFLRAIDLASSSILCSAFSCSQIRIDTLSSTSSAACRCANAFSITAPLCDAEIGSQP